MHRARKRRGQTKMTTAHAGTISVCKNVAFVESPALGSVERSQCIDVAVLELVVHA